MCYIYYCMAIGTDCCRTTSRYHYSLIYHGKIPHICNTYKTFQFTNQFVSGGRWWCCIACHAIRLWQSSNILQLDTQFPMLRPCTYMCCSPIVWKCLCNLCMSMYSIYGPLLFGKGKLWQQILSLNTHARRCIGWSTLATGGVQQYVHVISMHHC